jgi:hypothetical protein
MSHPEFPGSDLLEALGSQQFRDAFLTGLQEAIKCNDFNSGVDCFDQIARQNGLYAKVASAMIMEIAKAAIRWYFEEQRKNKMHP